MVQAPRYTSPLLEEVELSARSEHLTEEAGLLICYGKQFSEGDEDCDDCALRADCETLTGLRKAQGKATRVAKRIPTFKPSRRDDEDDEEEEEEEWRAPWAEQARQVPDSWYAPPSQETQQKTIPQQYGNPHYMVPHPPTPMQPYMQPGMHCSAQMIQHPAPHLTYMMANPVDCPMPIAGEKWYKRVALNVASAALSEGGRQFYEFFRRFRF